MRITNSLLAVALTVAGAAGCTAENPAFAPDRVTLAGALKAAALDVAPSSRVAVHEQGALNPAGTDVKLAIEAADVRLKLPARGAPMLEALSLSMADRDRAPDAQVPDGLYLRDQRLVSEGPLALTVVERDSEHVLLRGDGRLRWEASMLLTNGTRYPLGGARTVEAPLTVALRLDDAGAPHMTLEAAPRDACAEIGGLMTLSGCVLSVETTAQLDPM